MTVTKIEQVAQMKYKVYIDGQFAFILYKGELLHYDLKEGSELDEEIYKDIVEKFVLKRAKLRAMNLLTVMDRTESQLRTKLKQNQYPDEVIDAALEYVKSFHYVDDARFAEQYILSNQDSKSRKELYVNLCNKGVNREQAEEVLDACYGNDEEVEAIHKIVQKRKYDPRTATDKDRQKICAYLARKGFKYENIRQVIQLPNMDA